MGAIVLVLGCVIILLFLGSTDMELTDALPGATLIEAVGIGGMVAGWIGVVGGISLWILCFIDGDTLIRMRTPVKPARR
jgi:hypothetical protein